MKKSRKSRLILTLGYVAFVALLLLGTRCEHRVHLTTPERDAKLIAEYAELARSEAELKVVEKMRAEYEAAYRKSYGGAKALYFRSLVDPIVDEAGDRREAYAAEEEYLQGELDKFHGKLNDLDRAWRMKLGSREETLAIVERNNAARLEAERELEAMIAHKEQLAIDIVEAGYPESMLNEIGEVEAGVEAKREEIAKMEYENSIVVLAYRLQRGEELVVEAPVAETSAIEDAALEAPVAEEVETTATDEVEVLFDVME